MKKSKPFPLTDQTQDYPAEKDGKSENLFLLDKLAGIFDHVTSDPFHNINLIVNTLHTAFSGSCTMYQRVETDREILVTVSGCGLPPGMGEEKPAKGTICFTATMEQDHPVVISNLFESRFFRTDPRISQHGFKSYIGAKVAFEGDIFGTLCVFDSTSCSFSQAKVKFIQVLARALSFEERRWEDEEKVKKSLKRLNAVFEYAPEAYYLSDFTGTILDGNLASERLLGYDRREVIGNNYLDMDILSEDQVPKALSLLQANQKGLPTGPDIFALTRKDKQKVHVEISTFPVNIQGEDIALGIARDVTEQKRVEEALKASEKRLAQIVEGNSIPTFVIDQNHMITHWNRACENITGVRAKDVIGGKTGGIIFYSDNRPILADLVLDEVTDAVYAKYYGDKYKKSSLIEGAYEVEDFFPRLGETGRWFFFTAAPLRDDNGKITGIIETVLDITERKQAEEALLKAKNELEEKVRERTLSLEEANTALRVLLKGRDEDKKALEKNMLYNINELVMPYIDKLCETRLSERQTVYLDIIRSNLKDIVSPIMQEFSVKYLKLTPMEIQVANLIRLGKTTKEIAELSNLSPRTIECHRDNIRKKIGISNKKINLRTYLLSSR